MKRILAIIIVLISMLNAHAQIGAQHAFDFLRLPVSTRAIGMGGVLPAYNANDLSVALASPSLLDKSYNRNFTVNQEIMFGGILHGQAAYARYNEKYDATWVANIQYLNYGNFIRADETGNKEGHFGAEDLALQFGFGKSLNPRWNYGANAKLIYSRYDDLYSTAAAADLSASYKDTVRKLCITFQIANFGAQIKPYYPRLYYENNKAQTLPTDVRLGISKRLAHMPFSLQITAHHLQTFDIRYNNPADNVSSNIFGQDTASTKPKKYTADKIFRHFVFGGEFYFGKHVTVQVGYNHLRRQELKTASRNGMIGFSGGVHISTKRFTFGYSRAWYYLPSATNTLSLSFLI